MPSVQQAVNITMVEVPNQHHCICIIITVCKRSLRRFCFYTCLSVILFTGGGGVPGQVHPSRPGTPPWTRCSPRTRYTPRTRYPLGRHPQAGTHQTRYTPRQVLSGQVHPPPADFYCCGRYA